MKVSIITPCYNQGIYLDELLESIESTIKSVSYEVLILDDGSKDEFTIKKYVELESRGYTILRQTNMGLSKARNNLINLAKGEYIVPLDSDNKLNIGFIDKGVFFLDNNQKYDVLYTDCIHFSDKGEFYNRVGDFDLHRLIYMNYIDACAMFRKSTWVERGGYDTEMKLGHEDWDLWLNMAFSGSQFYYLAIPGFYYRVSENSMNQSITIPNVEKNIEYLRKKYKDQIASQFRMLFKKYEKYDWLFNVYMKKKKLKSIFKILFNKW